MLHKVIGIFFVIVKICVILLQPYPGLNDSYYYYDNCATDPYNYKINHFLVLFGLFRLYFILEWFLSNNPYFHPRAIRVCKMYGGEQSDLYSIRSNFKDNPFMLLTGVFILSIFVFAFAFRVS